MDSMIGRRIGGFHVLDLIGKGGMARVYKAYHVSFDRFVALKILSEEFVHQEEYVERFKREARYIAKLEHLHILPVFDFGEDNGTIYLAMRYMQAGTLGDILQLAEGPLPLPDVVRINGQIASALDYAHDHNIIHRDVKPTNIMVDRTGDAFLMDFGIAKQLEATINLTKTGGSIGTPAYMSPEQAMGRPADFSSDVYSLGAMTYEMLAGRPPFVSDNPLTVMLAHEHEQVPDPLTFNSALSPRLVPVLFQALAKKPEQRYRRAGDFAAALQRAALVHDTAQMLPTPTLQVISNNAASQKPTDQVTVAVRREVRRHKPQRRLFAGFAVMAFLLMLIAAVIGFMVFQNIQQERITARATQVQSAFGAVTPDPATLQGTPAAGVTPEVVRATPTFDQRAIATALPTETVNVTATGNQLAWCDGDICVCSGDTCTALGLSANYDFSEMLKWSPGVPASWSPDGTQFAFAGKPFERLEHQILIANRDGSGIRVVYQAERGITLYSPVWSPDGSQIAAIVNASSQSIDALMVVQPNGLNKAQITGWDIHLARALAWSPDSAQIAYLNGGISPDSGFRSNYQIGLIERDGANPQLIFDSGILDLAEDILGWTADGNGLMVASADLTRVYQIDKNCVVQPEFCGPSSSPQLDAVQVHWLHTFTPMWVGETGGE